MKRVYRLHFIQASASGIGTRLVNHLLAQFVSFSSNPCGTTLSGSELTERDRNICAHLMRHSTSSPQLSCGKVSSWRCQARIVEPIILRTTAVLRTFYLGVTTLSPISELCIFLSGETSSLLDVIRYKRYAGSQGPYPLVSAITCSATGIALTCSDPCPVHFDAIVNNRNR